MSDKFGEALGIWHLTVGGANFELRPKMGDNRKFRRLLMNEEYKKDKAGMMEKFEDYLFELIKRDHPQDDEAKIKEYIEFNTTELFEQTLVKFRWTSQAELDKAKKETLVDLKKLTDDS